MTNYENDHLNPPNEREIKTCDCEDCDTSGEIMVFVKYGIVDEGHYETTRCMRCNGLGYLEY